ncbi:hypothetical protein AWM75_02150 [Aerococcus urinaehominis]|uniref:Uncharacterized protein n=1 Tax=Aerococcus urinaehominis TaxID=128944 RepID=A0A0X8FKA2_9LACT|nr:ComGF family competence protein [Aerococcus urinaehominis]AMB98865.1 hypothetical protein AWM75_02150 [Aerococcus urinaehominis]SDM16740.1 Putative Competence protein ComGF [Aerococcus urinaehominis]
MKKLYPLLNKRAFTLIECIFALAVFAIIQLSLGQTLQGQINFNQSLSQNYLADYALFEAQVIAASQTAYLTGAGPHVLSFKTTDQELISFEHYQNVNSQMIRRRKKGQGHHPVLMQVANFSVQQLSPHAVMMTTEMTNGEVYTCQLNFKVANNNEAR